MWSTLIYYKHNKQIKHYLNTALQHHSESLFPIHVYIPPIYQSQQLEVKNNKKTLNNSLHVSIYLLNVKNMLLLLLLFACLNVIIMNREGGMVRLRNKNLHLQHGQNMYAVPTKLVKLLRAFNSQEIKQS